VVEVSQAPEDRPVIGLRSASILAALVMLGYLSLFLALRNEPMLRSTLSDFILSIVNALATISLFIAASSSSHWAISPGQWLEYGTTPNHIPL
jgi:hypothetical protein